MAKLYYYSNSSRNWNLASNWWFNSNHTTPAGRKPTSADDIIILADSIEPWHPNNTVGALSPLIYNSLSCLRNFGTASTDLISFATSAIFVNSTITANISAGTGMYFFGNSTFTGWDEPDYYGSNWYRTERNIYAPNIYFYNTSRAASIVNGTSYFYNSAANTAAFAYNGVIAAGVTINGNAYFYNNSKTESTVNGNAYFYNNSTSSGSITLSAFYYDDSLMRDPTGAGFLDITNYKNIEKPYQFYSTNGAILRFTTSNQLTLTGNQNFNLSNVNNNSNGDYDYFSGNVSNNAVILNAFNQPITSFVFKDSAVNVAYKPNVLWRNYIAVSATFFDFSKNNAIIQSGTFNDYSVNTYHISGNAIFNNYSNNQGIVTKNAYFNNSSINTISGFAFNGYFNDNSINNGTANIGYFNNNSINTNTVITSAFYYNGQASNNTLYINKPQYWGNTRYEYNSFDNNNKPITAVNIRDSYNSGNIPFTTYFTGSSYNIGKFITNSGFLSAGIFSFWNFDDPSNPGFDSGPNQNNIPLTVTPALTSGMIGSGLSLYGYYSNQNITPKSVLPTNSDFTITFWHYGVKAGINDFSSIINTLWTYFPTPPLVNRFVFGTWNDQFNPSPLSAVAFAGFIPNILVGLRGIAKDVTNYAYTGIYYLNQWYFYSVRGSYSTGYIEIRQNNIPVFNCLLDPKTQWPSGYWLVPYYLQTNKGESLDMLGIWNRMLSNDELNYLYNDRNGNNFSNINNTIITPTTYFNEQSYNGSGGKYINVVYNSIKKGVNGPSLLL